MKFKFIYPALVALSFFGLSCTGEQVQEQTIVVAQDQEIAREYDALVNFVEQTSDLVNSPVAPAVVLAPDVYANADSYHLIDLRSEADYVNGHIDGAHNVSMDSLLGYMETLAADRFEKIVLICPAGQIASYAGGALRLIGYGNVYAMKFGMSAWHKDFAASKWLSRTSDKYQNSLETNANPKNESGGSRPQLETGATTPYAILKARVAKVLAQPTGKYTLGIDAYMENPEKYYTINYWPIADYDKGHLPGAVHYQPKSSLSSTADLSTIPADRPVLVYCYSGHHSAFVTAYLRALGYDAVNLVYGTNSFMHTLMKSGIGHDFSAKLINDYEYITGAQVSNKVQATKSSDQKKEQTPDLPPVKKKVTQQEGGGC